MRKIELIYKLRRRTFNIDDLILYLFLLTPIMIVLLVTLLWFALGAGGKD